MNFTSIPDNYASTKKPLIYQFTLDQMCEKVDVKVVDVTRNRVLCIKRLYDVQSAQIDIAPILEKNFRYEFAEGGTAILPADGLFAEIVVEIEETSSPSRYFSPYPLCNEVGTLFRNTAKLQAISRNESDIVILYAPQGCRISCESYCEGEVVDVLDLDFPPSNGLLQFRLVASDFSQDAEEIVVQFVLGDIVDFMTYRILPSPEHAHRLVWVDAEGILQLYTFPTCRERRLSVEKQRALSSEGLIVVASDADMVLTLVSDYETIAEMERLGGIIEARQVWVECDGRGIGLDIVSSESVVRYGGALNSLQIEIRPSDRKESLR